jgi:heat shock protein HslJ
MDRWSACSSCFSVVRYIYFVWALLSVLLLGDISNVPARSTMIRGIRLAAASEAATAGEAQITGTAWQWVQTLYSDGRKSVPAKPENYTVRFLEDGKVNVRADCNQKGGSYSTEGSRLSIEITTSTRAACEEGSLEEPFVRDLMAGAVFFLKDGDLHLDLKYDAGTMIFSRP